MEDFDQHERSRCAVYSCTLAPGEHRSAESSLDERGVGELWHHDERTGVSWPEWPSWEDEGSDSSQAFSERPLYHPGELHQQLKDRKLKLGWARSSWLQIAEDVDFAHSMLMQPASFNGDSRPAEPRGSLSLWGLLASEQKVQG